jgi:hypothetical protein
MKATTTITLLPSAITMTGMADLMRVRMADVIGARIMGTTAARMSDLTGENITTGMRCLATVTTTGIMIGLTDHAP